MERKMLIIVCIVAVSLAASVAAHPRYQSDTPLYTIRMEQASSEMNFLPTQMTTFTYNAEKGYELSYDIAGFCSAEPLADTGEPITCDPLCKESIETCPTNEYTCPNTCEWTCFMSTCPQNTCSWTCYTCPEYTCNPTCRNPYTCHLSTCVFTCNPTCIHPRTCYLSSCMLSC